MSRFENTPAAAYTKNISIIIHSDSLANLVDLARIISNAEKKPDDQIPD